jgi:hypothetical protein
MLHQCHESELQLNFQSSFPFATRRAAAQIAALEAKISAMQNSPLAAVGAPVSASGSASASAGPSRLGSADVEAEEYADRASTGLENVEEMPSEEALDVDLEMEIENMKRIVEEDLERAGVGQVERKAESQSEKGKGRQAGEVTQTGGETLGDSGQAGIRTSAASATAPSRPAPRPVGLPPKPSAAVLQQSHTPAALR